MPLPNPWKTASAPRSPSPIRRKTSLRHRNKARIGLLILIAVLSVCALNELRCMKYGCVSRIGFYSGTDRGHKGGGATLPDDWKYRLGEQLKMNMQGADAPPLASSDNKQDKAKEKEKEQPPNGALVEPVTITPTIDPPKPVKQHTGGAGQNAEEGGRWVDSPPGPASPDPKSKEQMKADKQTYVDGDDIEAPAAKLNEPPTEASENPLASPSPGVQAAAEDLRLENSTTTAAASTHDAKGTGQQDATQDALVAAPPPPKLDKTKEKVDSAIAQKTVAKASQPASKPRPKTKHKPAAAAPSSAAPPTSDATISQKTAPPPPPPHTHDASNFGSMEMGLLMAGG